MNPSKHKDACFQVLSPWSYRLALVLLSSCILKPLNAQELQPTSGFTFTPLSQTSELGDREPPSRAPLEELEPRPLPPPTEFFVPPLEPQQPLEGEIPGTIIVEGFEVVGSTVFSAEDFAPLFETYTNRPLSFSELLSVRTAVTNYYEKRGYITTGAIIPPQELSDGIVQIQVIEGGIEAIEVSMEGRLSPAYVRERLERATTTPVNVNQLKEALQLLQLDPLIRSLSAELSASPRAGFNLLTINAVTADTFDLNLLVDNGRSPSVGTMRRQISVVESNLLGIGDQILGSYTNTDGSNAFDFGYRIPVNAKNGTVRLAYGRTDSEVIEKPFTPLDIQSESRYYELSFRQPVVLTPTQELAVGITASRQESENFLLGERFPLSTGADEEGRTRVSALRFFQEWTQRGEREVLSARSQFSVGVDWLGATVNEDAPDSNFLSWRGQGQWVKLLAKDTLFLLRTDLQLASQALLPLEQIGLGGFNSVRGYRQDVSLSDNGWLASAEVRLPILRVEKWDSLLQVTPFFDLGTAWNNSRNGENRATIDSNVLAGVGVGLRWQTGNNLTARLDWGIPLIAVDSRNNTLQEKGIYFSLLYNPF